MKKTGIGLWITWTDCVHESLDFDTGLSEMGLLDLGLGLGLVVSWKSREQGPAQCRTFFWRDDNEESEREK